MLSKRSYEGHEVELLSLASVFNRIRPRTAEIQVDKDGKHHLYVQGWSDWNAAAVYELIASGIPPDRITSPLIASKSSEMFHSGRGLSAASLGTVIMSDRGSEAPVEVEPEQEEQPQSRIELPPEFDPTLPPGANLPGSPRGSTREQAESRVGRDTETFEATGTAAQLNPPRVRAKPILGRDEQGNPCLMIEFEGHGAGPERRESLLRAERIKLNIEMAGPPLRWLQALSHVHQRDPAEYLAELVEDAIQRAIKGAYYGPSGNN